MAKHDATQPGRDRNGNTDPNHWEPKHATKNGADADKSQGKDKK